MRLHIVLSAAFAAATGCGPTVGATNPPDGGRTDEECFDFGLRRCDDGTAQECRDGYWWDVETCAFPEFCVNEIGCAECNPVRDTTCVGDEVHGCDEDGTIGAFLETCPEERCVNGACAEPDCGSDGVKLIYVVDQAYNLLSFDPGSGNLFTLVGSLDCPAGTSLPDWGTGVATPFSMSVDRQGLAWVLYTSGQIFLVSTEDASCSPSGWPPTSLGYELFGMGFVADTPDAHTEKLYIAGGDAADLSGGNLAFIDPATLSVTTVGPLPLAEYSPELTGTGDAELFAYFPGFSTYVSRVDRSTGQNTEVWALPALGGSVQAWAFAHWGGLFFIFVTWQDDITLAQHREVYRLDPATGAASLLLADMPYVIVGAGVSTCAPVIIP